MVKIILFVILVVILYFIWLTVYACCVVAGRADQLMGWDSKSQFKMKDMEDYS
ncbi:hypothetical protein [Enterococcus sp. RIT-PI-f]|uniref:hypothetical protein n=1 Tax=Enterococcus sp. RIT-PI-f TaxID=1690244 RepID=UPI00356191C6